MAAAICRHVGAQRIVVTDVNDYRLALAERMGATMSVNVTRSSIEEARERLGIIGFDIGLEMSGSGTAFESMLENMYHGGRIALLGILPNSTGIRWDQVIFKGLVIKGIYGREIFETWYKMQTMLQSGLDIAPVITHELPFEEYETGFAAMIRGESGKVVLELAGPGDAEERA
jgi:threonine 3-dehydrogenase